MPDWAVGGGQRYASLGEDLTNSTGVAVVPGVPGLPKLSSSLVAGGWYPIGGVTPFDASGVYFNFNSNGTALRFLVDLGIAATNTVLIPDIALDRADTICSGIQIFFPIAIPAGTQLAVRAQGGSGPLYISLMLVAGDLPPALSIVTAYGVANGVSGGTDIIPTLNAKAASSFTWLSPNTTYPITQLLMHVGTRGRASSTNGQYLLDLSIGLPSTNPVIIPNIPIQISTSKDNPGQCYYGPYAIDIPAGSSLSARCQVNTSGGNISRTIAIILYGVS